MENLYSKWEKLKTCSLKSGTSQGHSLFLLLFNWLLARESKEIKNIYRKGGKESVIDDIILI